MILGSLFLGTLYFGDRADRMVRSFVSDEALDRAEPYVGAAMIVFDASFALALMNYLTPSL